MRKRFLHICKNPLCSQEFGILHDKAGELRVHCPHCRKLQKVIQREKSKIKKKR